MSRASYDLGQEKGQGERRALSTAVLSRFGTNNMETATSQSVDLSSNQQREDEHHAREIPNKNPETVSELTAAGSNTSNGATMRNAAIVAPSSADEADVDTDEPPNTPLTQQPPIAAAGKTFQQVPAKVSKVMEEKWEKMFQKLLSYKDKHGNTLVPNRYDEDPSLGSWVSTQRRQYKVLVSGSCESTPISLDRARRLEQIGFVWKTGDPRHVPWDERFQELLEFKKKYGHVQVPIGYKDNTKLGNWVSTQRQERRLQRLGRKCSRRLTKERIAALDSISFVWEAQRGGARSTLKRKPDRTEEGESQAEENKSSQPSESKRKRSTAELKPAATNEPPPYPPLGDVAALETEEDNCKKLPPRTSEPEAILPAASAAFAPPHLQQQLAPPGAPLLFPEAFSDVSLRGSSCRRLVPPTTLIESQLQHNNDPVTRLRLLQAEEHFQARLNRQLRLRQVLGESSPFDITSPIHHGNIPEHSLLGNIQRSHVNNLLGTSITSKALGLQFSNACNATTLARALLERRLQLGAFLPSDGTGDAVQLNTNVSHLRRGPAGSTTHQLLHHSTRNEERRDDDGSPTFR